MIARGVLIGLGLSALSVTVATPQGLEIDHKAVGCIVVGKYPKMNACFTPAPNVARSRVYFRPEGTPSWYYVDMKSDQPCLTGILPKPSKKLVGKHVEYYLEAQNKAFVPSRTAEYAPIVVRSAQECKKDIPVAPFLNNATVAVFPSVPAGFVGAGGIGTAAVVGIVGAGAAAATTAVVVASNNNDDNTTTTIASSVNTTTLPTVTTTLVTTTTTLKVNHAPNAVLRVKPDPPQGPGPLTVTFDMCGSSDSDGDPLSFFFNFGDGNKSSGSCIDTHTYAASFREASSGKVSALDASYTFEGSVVDPSGASQTRTRTVIAQLTPPPTTSCPDPKVTINFPTPNACVGTPTFTAMATASDSKSVSFSLDQVQCMYSYIILASNVSSGTANGSGPTYSVPLTGMSGGCYLARATAQSSCGSASATATPVYFGIQFSGTCSLAATKDGLPGAAAWESDLRVEGGRLQVVINGTQVAFPPGGRAYGMAALTDGENRVEATLIEGAGKAGLWRFDFMGSRAVASGSVRVISGEVAAVAASSITFRLKGTPGERVAFAFQKR